MSQIITSQQVIDRTGADSTTADLIASAINKQIETATGRVWGETKEVTELYDAANVLWLRNMDVQAVDSVKTGFPNETRTTLAVSEYSWNIYGRITLSYLPFRELPPSTNDYVEVSYTYGVEEVPADLILAALSLAASSYDYSIEHSGKAVTSERIGSYAVTYAGSKGESDEQSAGSREWQVIRSYGKRRV
jgi:hypothetical protein